MKTGNLLDQALTASLPVFTDANKQLITKSIADARTALGVGTGDSYRGLKALVNAAHTDHQVDLTIDEIILQDANYFSKAIHAVSVTVDLAAAGANGLDTGAEAGTTWYYLWVLAKADGTTCGVFSLSSTTPTFPAGYTFKALVGAWKNDVSSNLVNQIQLDRVCGRLGGAGSGVLASGTQESYTAVDCSALVPPTARMIGCYGGSYANDVSLYVAATSSGLAAQQLYIPISWGFLSFIIPCPTSQNFYYKVDTGGSANIWLSSWWY